ncbi:MAG: hypothetical protein HY904_21130 [Deltaproteobacteria bacterium]|nr:hypothetical protein [Deltaproteobacteria bacterium]
MEPLEFDLADPAVPPCGRTRHTLRRHFAGELDAAARADLDNHLKECLDCQAVLAELKSDEAAFKVHIPFARFADQHEKRLAAASPVRTGLSNFWKTVFGGGVALAAAMTAAAFLLIPAPRPEDQLTERIKGGGIGFLLRTSDGVRAGRDGETLKPGDQIQFFVKAPEDTEVVVVGVDGKGAVSVYHVGRVVAVDGRAAPLPDSVVLDDAVGPERFFAVYGRGFAAGELKALVQKAAEKMVADGADLRAVETLPLDLPADKAQQSSVHIVKLAR